MLQFFYFYLRKMYYNIDVMNEIFMNTGIEQLVIDHIIELAEKYSLEKVILFGARAKGVYQEDSDINLAIEGENTTLFSLDVDEYYDDIQNYEFYNINRTHDNEFLNQIEEEGISIYDKDKVEEEYWF